MQGTGAQQVRAVINEGAELDPKNVEAFRMLRARIAEFAFRGSTVAVQLCDRNLKTLREHSAWRVNSFVTAQLHLAFLHDFETTAVISSRISVSVY